MKDVQAAHALLGLFERFYHEKVGRETIINRYRDKWGMIDTIETLGYDNTKETLEFFFETNGPYTLKNFYTNSDKIYESMLEVKADKEYRERLRQQTRELVEEDESRSPTNNGGSTE